MLADEDLDFLHQVFEEAGQFKPIVDRHPEYQDLVAQVVRLYAHISAEALENET